MRDECESQSYLLNNVEDEETADGEDDTEGDERCVESRREHRVHKLTVIECDVVFRFLVQRIQLTLSHCRLIREPASHNLDQSSAVHEQRHRSNKRARNEHILLIEDQTTCERDTSIIIDHSRQTVFIPSLKMLSSAYCLFVKKNRST